MDDNILEHALGTMSRKEWERLGRFLEGESTPEEVRVVEVWLAADPRRRELVWRIERARLMAVAAPGVWGGGEAWARLVARLEGVDSRAVESAGAASAEASATVLPFPPRPATPASRRRGGFAVAVRIAATVVALVGGTILWQNRATLIPPPEVGMRELAADVGQRMRITLADGTSVILGPESRLWVPDRFGPAREVRLEGEAVFEVATDSARAFRVRTTTAVTQVLGTRFSVRAYPEDPYVEVVVAEGRVAVASASAVDEDAKQREADTKRSPRATEPRGTQLTSGFAVRVTSDGTLSAPQAVDADRALSWAEGRLIFDGTPLHEVVATLERRYGISIELENSGIAALRLTAEFREPIPGEIVRLIARSLGIEHHETSAGYLLSRSTRTVDTPHDGHQIP
jgi:transmembrane sensor